MLPFVVQEFRRVSQRSNYHLSFFTFHLSLFTYHLSLFTYHLSLITFHFSLITFHLSLINVRHRFIPEGEKDYRQAVERSETSVS